MIRIGVAAFDEIEAMIFEAIAGCLAAELEAEVRVAPGRWDAGPAYNEARKQYSAPALLKMLLEKSGARGEDRLLGVTRRDLYIPMLSFVYGQAQLDGRAAVISLARLEPEFYGLAANGALVAERAAKEALHETGHTLGLVHCGDASCAMALSTNLRQLDLKRAALCAACGRAARVRAAGRQGT
jgi:archaemetzincin